MKKESIDGYFRLEVIINYDDLRKNGGLIFTNFLLSQYFEKDFSYDRFSHLLKRIDLSPEEGYKVFQENDKTLENQSIKSISKLTRKILSGRDYEFIKKRRKENFTFLHEALKENNCLTIEIDKVSIPMVYPFRTKDKDLKSNLISEKIYCATYWPNVLEWTGKSKNSYHLTKEIIALPIDKRLTNKELNKVLKVIK